MKKTELLVVVSDLHCGSVVGIAPPETELQSGNVVGFGKNLHQAWLWDCWLDMTKKVKAIVGDSTASLLVNGDATEGAHHRNNAELMASEIEIHTDMATEVLRPLLELCPRRFVVKGTECHTREMESLLADKIKAETRQAKEKWLLNIHGCVVDATHHIGTTSRAYLEASLMSIAMGNARLNAARAGHVIPKVFLRAHRHCHGYFSDGEGLLGITGAWQWLTRHGHKVVPDSIPRPSVIVLDWRESPKGTLPRVHEIIYTPKQNEITDC